MTDTMTAKQAEKLAAAWRVIETQLARIEHCNQLVAEETARLREYAQETARLNEKLADVIALVIAKTEAREASHERR